MIVVFNSGFDQKLTAGEQRLHLLAIALIAIAVAMIMAPAAYSRQKEPREATVAFVTIATRLLLCSMFPLAVGICVDFYLIAKVILGGPPSAWLASGLFAVFMTLWFVLPQARALQRLLIGYKKID